MNRRKAIIRISLAGTAIIGSLAGYKWYSLAKSPDRDYLVSKKALLNALADTIIPPTDTPGAAEAGVGEYMLNLLLKCTDRKNLNIFVDGIKDLEGYCDDRFSRSFIKCSAEEREKTLAHFEKKGKGYSGLAGKIQNKYLGNSFFYTLKSYTVEGYCRSKQGATEALSYVYIPGSFNGCIPLEPGQKSWATN